jgi:regulatory protein
MTDLLILRDKALSFLSRRNHTEYELRQKLQQRFPDAAETIEQVLTELKAERLIDDATFARQWLEHRSTLSPRGKFFLKQELKKKGVEATDINAALQETEIEEIDLARRAAEIKLRSLKNLPPQKRQEKLVAFLLRRGFEYEVIREVLKNFALSNSNISE